MRTDDAGTRPDIVKERTTNALAHCYAKGRDALLGLDRGPPLR